MEVRRSPGPPTQQQPRNRYNILMDEALETMTEHARVLEHTAEERHRRRLEQSKDRMNTVLDDAIQKINSITDSKCATQKQDLECFCEAQVESLISDLDNFSGQARRIQQEVLNGVQDGAIASKTVPPDDDDMARLGTTAPPPKHREPPIGKCRCIWHWPSTEQHSNPFTIIQFTGGECTRSCSWKSGATAPEAALGINTDDA